ncbi:MAG TPA: ribonuclease HII, partial [Clostridia bacterium]|nr:ribonuclease HII [Clostridia bacterium]
AMEKAVIQLPVQPDYLLVDAMKLERVAIPHEALIKGDARSGSIAAASILAKVTRDTLMIGYDTLYPDYGFARHKGYGTRAHYDQLLRLGPCPIHRQSFLKTLDRHR